MAKNQIEELGKRAFAKEIENDKEVINEYFTSIKSYKEDQDYKDTLQSFRNGNQPQATLSNEIKNALQNKLSSDVLKRALILLGSGDMGITNGDNKKPASENKLPIASYLSHGARAMVEIPPGSSNNLINWLTSGNKDVEGRSYNQTQQGAIEEGKIVFKRRAATHDVKIDNNQLTELKGFGIGLRDGIKSFFTNTNHFGVNLNLNPHNDAGDVPDGDHGHLYIHYKAPTADQPGSLLIGLEASEPSSSKHSKTGASDPMSPVGSSLWEDLNVKKGIAAEQEYEKTVIPQKYNGLFVRLDTNKLEAITALNHGKVDALDANFASRLPTDNVKDFMANKNLHQTPEMNKPKEIQEPQEPKYYGLKKFINIVSKFLLVGFIIKPFKEELKTYEKDKKNFKIQNKVCKAFKEKPAAPSNDINMITNTLGLSLQQNVANKAVVLVQDVKSQLDPASLKISELQQNKIKDNTQGVS